MCKVSIRPSDAFGKQLDNLKSKVDTQKECIKNTYLRTIKAYDEFNTEDGDESLAYDIEQLRLEGRNIETELTERLKRMEDNMQDIREGINGFTNYLKAATACHVFRAILITRNLMTRRS
jgi:hypothetical protein